MAAMRRKKTITLPEVHFSEDGDIRYLHLDSPWIQGSMLIKKPYDIELYYVQRMMAWLLFMPAGQVTGAHAMQLGLGAGTLTKFCYKKLKMTCTAIELNPGVLHACRGWFRLPPDDERLRVVIADAAQEIRSPEWTGVVDALQVDLYDHEAAAPVLDSEDFYRDCHALLTPGACMTVNLLAGLRASTRASRRSAPLLANRRSGPSSPPAKATPWCWPSAHPPAPLERSCLKQPNASKPNAACRPPSG